MKILVVEDEFLIAIDLQDHLEKLGHDVMGPAESCTSALELIFRTRPDLAIVDTHLGSETCEVVLDELRVQQIPVVICSGYTKDHLPAFASQFPLLEKPYSPETIHAALSNAPANLGAASGGSLPSMLSYS